MTSFKISLLVIAALTAGSSSAFAAILASNTTIAPTPLLTPVSGTVVDGSTNAFIGKDTFNNVVFTGSETTTVYSGDVGNTLGGLTFVYAVHNDSTSADTIDRITLSGFGGFSVDASYVVDGNSIPTTADRSFTGGIVGFNLPVPNTLIPGATTTKLVLRTNAPSDTAITLSAIDGGTGTASSFGPQAPEPASLSLLGAGALLLIRRRRQG